MTSPPISHGESHHLDRKSLRQVTGPKADFSELAHDCVCFANGAGGALVIGIENDDETPPADQRVDQTLLDRIKTLATPAIASKPRGFRFGQLSAVAETTLPRGRESPEICPGRTTRRLTPVMREAWDDLS